MYRRFFTTGLLLGLVLFGAANLYSYWIVKPPCCDVGASFGFPFPIGTYGVFHGAIAINWQGMISNALTSLGVGFVLGSVFARLCPAILNLFHRGQLIR